MSKKNLYAPWKEEGITELEYFKRAYLRLSKHLQRIEAMCENTKTEPELDDWYDGRRSLADEILRTEIEQ